MKGTDKFLIGIVIGAILLVIVAFIMAFLQPEPTYQAEDRPEGVAYNYLLALQQADHERAYSYLSPSLRDYPASVEEFTREIDRYGWDIRDLENGSISLVAQTGRLTGDRADVTVQATHFYQGGLFESSQYTNTFEMRLQRENEAWKIIASDSYWLWCWDDKEGCEE